ncbi:MAG: DHH family phosphoesterase, partial [Leptospiraceae bacterium]|nr:DHH family phosphoesterase [Leptospiraceae bacterium]
MRDWFSRTSNRPSLLAEAIYHRFLDRLALYAGEKIDEDTLRAHALRYLVPEFYLLRSPFALPDMAEAVKLLRAFAEGPKLRKLVLYGDRDADGITSTAMLWLFCRHKLGIPGEKITALLPREQDKYGITDEVAARIAAENPELLITLDCGSSNKQELSRLKAETGTKIIIIDHHFIPEQSTDFPEVEAFVNPKRLAEPDFVRDYATAAVVLRFIQAVLFSYSKEYGEPIGIKTPGEQFVLTNGVRDEQSDFASCQRKYFIGPNPPEGCHDLLAIFAHMARQDHAVFRLWEFYRALPEAFSAVEIFNLVQSASFRKSRRILEPYLALAAIGLVADLMPVYADNRIMIRAGLAVMNHEQAKLPTGLDALLKRLNLQSAISEQDLAFRVAPAINAAGRMGNAMLALELLTAEDPLAATKAAHFLYETNSSRKAVSEQSIALLEEALDPRS